MPHIFSRARAITLAFVSSCLVVSPAFAGGPLKVGYLDLNKIKVLYPDAAQAESMKQNAELQLADVVLKANRALAQAQLEKKSPQDLEKLQKDLQLQVQGMQQGIRLMVDQQTSAAYQKISGVAVEVASDRGLDVVVDSNTVFAGGAPLLKNGEDLTDPVLRKLLAQQPGAGKTPSVVPSQPQPAAQPH
jgi:Skp family chaperone for outer membrane proteins